MNFSRALVFLTSIFLTTLVGCSSLERDTTTPTVSKMGASSAVAMPDKYGAQASEKILRQGGNAVDAAIAAAFVLAVTFPEAGNIGGGGFMLVHMDGEDQFLDYRETAPGNADRDMYLDQQGEVIPKLSLVGDLAAGVPGTVAGMWQAHQRFGTLPWAELVQPAIDLAKNGFIAPAKLVDSIDQLHPWFGAAGTEPTNFFKYFGHMKTGQLFKQNELAQTLQLIADHGPDGFYRGVTAEHIIAQMARGRGLISATDLDNYQAVWRAPLTAQWRDYTVVSAPPPSSGGFAVIQLLKMKDALASHFANVAHNSSEYIHLVAEIEKRVFADRAEYLGDPDFFDVPLNKLIDPRYLESRASEISPNNISTIASVPPGLESSDTTHFSIVDRWGNAVSNTYTINWHFGSGVIVEGAGFILNNEMDDFSVKPGAPNVYGVVGSTANEIQPNKRMLSSMSPTFLIKNHQVDFISGTPGGSTIFTSVFQSICNVLDFGMSPQQAVDATRFHHQLLPPDLITYSPSRPLSDKTRANLSTSGYRSEPHGWEFGDLQIIARDKNTWRPASDSRGRGVSKVIMH